MILGAIPAVTAAKVDLADTPAEIVTETPATEESEPQTTEETESQTEAVTIEPTVAVTEETQAPAETPTLAPKVKTELAPTAANYPAITKIAPSKAGLTLTWSAYSGAYKYMVFTLKSGGGWKKIGETTGTAFEHKNLTNNTEYTYTVRAADKNSKFISAYNTKGYTRLFLTSPKLLRTESVREGQKLVWEPVKGAEAYKVYIRSGSKWIVAGTTDTAYCINSRVTSGKAYTYTVRCWDVSDDFALSYYNTSGISGTFIAAPEITSFNAVKNGVSISWQAVDGASRYAVFRKLSNGWKRLGNTDKTSFSDTSIRYSARYTYTVRCIDKNGNFISGYNTAGWSFTHLAPPEISSVTYRNNAYTVSWNAQKTAASYRVFRKEPGGKWKSLGVTANTSFVDKKADKNGVYTYTVRTLDENGNYLTYYTENGRYYRMGIFVIGLDGTGKPNTTPRYTCAVTEDELRQMVACIATGWDGAVEGDEVHKDILAYYNTYVPLAVNYTMQTHDAWCAAFTSAVWIRAGIAPYIGTECGCGRFIDVAKENKIWVEADDYVPKVGDAIIYNWSDSGVGECVTGADHIGIVTSVNGSDFVVTEGNTGTGYVGTHDRVVNGQYIRGYITPNYALIAQYLTLKARFI